MEDDPNSDYLENTCLNGMRTARDFVYFMRRELIRQFMFFYP